MLEKEILDLVDTVVQENPSLDTVEFVIRTVVHRGQVRIRYALGYNGETNVESHDLDYVLSEFYRRHERSLRLDPPHTIDLNQRRLTDDTK